MSGRILAYASGLLALAGPMQAAGDADEAKGLVVEHYVKCHQVSEYSRDEGGLPTLETPYFGDMAGAPDI